MNRVIVVGASGSGKSTLAMQLAATLACPVIEIVALFWNPGWVQTPADEFRRRVNEAIASERWLASGNTRARDLIWRRADTLVWLDYSLALVMTRLFRRTIRRIVTHEELWGGNRETFRAQFLSRDTLFVYAIKSHARLRREYPVEFAKPEYAHLNVHHLHLPREAEKWLARLRMSQAAE